VRAHGTRARYAYGESGPDRANGCRCPDCCEANRAYARYQAKRKRLEPMGRTEGPWAAPFVDAAPVREHILELGRQGVGYKRVATLAGVSKTALLQIRKGRPRCRRELANAVLALPLTAPVADNQLVDATTTWKLIRQILRQPGWTKARLSAEIGQNGRALQLGRRHVTARSANAVARVADRLGTVADPRAERRVPAAPLLELDTVSALARRTDTHARQWHRWKTAGIPMSIADHVAVALGLHPAELWADWYADDLEETSA
jgi:hypothetical protein